jgi:hypothetical protein
MDSIQQTRNLYQTQKNNDQQIYWLYHFRSVTLFTAPNDVTHVNSGRKTQITRKWLQLEKSVNRAPIRSRALANEWKYFLH